jgi:enediyne biosynthesis protein E4
VAPGRRKVNRGRLALIACAVGIVVVAAAWSTGYLPPRASTTPIGALGPPSFVDETHASGLDFTYGGGDTSMIGGGVAVLDCDGNGLPDLFIAGGSNPSALYRNVSRPGGSLAFTRVEDPATRLRSVMGAYPIDIDGDGKVDLVVLRVGGVDLLRGMGDCRFQQANDAWSFAAPARWTTAFSATWEGAAKLPTMAFGNYVGLDASGNATYTCPDDELFRPMASGSGYASAIPLSPGYCALSMLFSDWDGSGRSDLRVSNDRHYYDTQNGEEQLWRVAAGEPPHLYTADEGWVQLQIWGMGIASYDLTGDGYPELYLTSQGPNMLQTLLAGPSQPTYRDIALKRGVAATRPAAGGDPLPSTAWHPEFQDVNNDGFMDLFVSKGNVDQVPDYASRDPSDLFIGQPNGTFTDAAAQAGILDFDRGRGAALADFNADGLLDLVQVNLDAPVRVWRNVGAGSASRPAPMGSWLGLRLQQPGPNRDAIGALLEVRVGDLTLRRELTVGGGHIGGQLGWTHFGLGPASKADVRVTWPDGNVGPWIGVDANEFAVLERGSAAAQRFDPGGTAK